MKKISSIFTLLVMALIGLSLTACSEDNLDTNQYQGGVTLNAYGPNPVMRGGLLRFVGSNLDQIASIQIPGCDPITNFTVVKSGVPSEISVTVPKDGPVEGIIKLITKAGPEIATTSSLTFTEPIVFEEFTPASVMPGDVLTIKGDYLNLVHLVAFTKDVLVSEDDFISHDRYSITVAVPEEARTGRVSLYTEDITKKVYDENGKELDVSYNIIESEDALTVGTPTVAKIASPRGSADALGTVTIKQGETLTVTGEYLQLVDSVSIGAIANAWGISADALKISADGKTLSFTLPAEAPDGDVNLITRSGVDIPVGLIVTIKPSNLKADPAPVKNGTTLTISGSDLDVVTTLQFPNVDGNTDFTYADNKITVVVPEKAQEGDIILGMANGASVTVAYTLVKPTVSGYDNNPVSAGGVLTIKGTDLDLVKSVKFGESDEAEVNVADGGSSMTLTVPMNAQAGEPTLLLKNGTEVKGLSLNINEALFCYATALPNVEEEEIKAGETMTLTVANGDKLTGVQINGKDCQYVLAGENKEKLIIGIPSNAGKGSKVRLISSNGEITYVIDVTPNTEVNTVLWSGTADMGNWSVNWQIGDGTFGANNPRMFADMEIQEGDVIHVAVTPYADYWQVQFFDGHWGGQSEIGVATGLNNGNNINAGIYNLEEHNGVIDIPVTATLLSQLTTLTDWGYCWILQGENIVITKISVTHYNVLEQTLWSGDLDFGNWSINWQIGDGTAGAGNPRMFVDAELKAGQTIRVYITPYKDFWQVQFFDGHWGGQAEIGNATGLNNGNNINSDIYNLDEHNGCIEIPVTATLAEQLTTFIDWGYCWILQGESCRATKITVE